ncbi:MAG: DUF1080 domain-containing protein [Acidobacteria bacterium]|nr:DUF1080 domain-containing protein [Acidobacteriota bacterium]
MKRSVLSIMAAATCFGGAEEFNGRWNLKAANEPRNRAWWLEVTGAGTSAMKGRFVGAPGGQLDEIPSIRIEGGELVWIFERGYEPGKPKGKGIYRARLSGGRLQGTFDVEGNPARHLTFTGKRAPVLKDRDDGKWKSGTPVELFDGRSLNGWASRLPGGPLQWRVEDGLLKNNDKAADIVSSASFWNFRLHVEYRVGPKSNSGIGLRGRYEVQIYEDYGRAPDGHTNGSVYSRIVPSVNASKPAGEWQTFDITIIGRTATVILNGKTIIDRKEVEGLTAMANDPDEDKPGPISLQGDHGPVEFRKITVTPLVR